MKAVIFDMDGVISDTERLHGIAESEILRKYGIDISAQELTDRYAGVSGKEMHTDIFASHGFEVPEIAKLSAKKYERLLEIAQDNIKPIQGAAKFIRLLMESDVKLGLASASRLDFIELVLTKLQLRDMFDAITSAYEVERGKPAPDIFLLTAKKIGVDPQQCVVIEDAKSGTVAAKSAGMKCIGFAGLEHSQQDLSQADLIINDFQELTMDTLQKL